MTDEEHAAAIAAAIVRLNAAVWEAHDAGLLIALVPRREHVGGYPVLAAEMERRTRLLPGPPAPDPGPADG